MEMRPISHPLSIYIYLIISTHLHPNLELHILGDPSKPKSFQAHAPPGHQELICISHRIQHGGPQEASELETAPSACLALRPILDGLM